MKYIKIFSSIILLLFAINLVMPISCFAQENEVAKLKQKVAELETRIKELEASLSKCKDPDKSLEQSKNTWENKKNWRKLTTGMNREEVLALLGEPIKTIEGVKTLWYYPDIFRGYVSFNDKGKLVGWQEP
jgi:outer membrane protein assembly factor BamE (lipoprotein component of BamABCDE complex)